MNLRKNHEMLLHFVMAFIGGYFGLYAIVARNDLFGSAQTSNLIYLGALFHGSSFVGLAPEAHGSKQ